MNNNFIQEESSFRDPAGFVFSHNNEIYRTVSFSYKEIYEELKKKDLHKILINKGYLIPFEEVNNTVFCNDIHDVYKILKPQKIPFINYPYEWSFTQLQKAAILTLDIQLYCLQNGFTLKDASAFNIQFIGNKPYFIDLLSFEPYKEDRPWIAYKQFCEHFLNPLVLSQTKKINALNTFNFGTNGISTILTSKLLPFKSKLNLFNFLHIYLHAKSIKKNETKTKFNQNKIIVKKEKLINMLLHLKEGIKNMNLSINTNWENYYDKCSYDCKSIENKKNTVRRWIELIKPNTILDIGCNDGTFSVLCEPYSNYIIAIDNDFSVINSFTKKNNSQKILPLIIDITSPTPSIGWKNKERKNFVSRLEKNITTLALAIIHHIRFTQNIPIQQIASFFAEFSDYLIIEFIPKSDPQVKKLLISKNDIYFDYNQENFEKAFQKSFLIKETYKITESERILYLLKRK